MEIAQTPGTGYTDPVKALALRANVSLGESLVKLRLAKEESIAEQGLPTLRKHLDQDNIKRASLLKIMSWDLNLINEKEVIDHHIEDYNLGYCDLGNYNIDQSLLANFTFNECWATMSLPFDLLEGVFFVASCSYLSKVVVTHWEKRLCRDIVWFIIDLSSLTMTLERLEKDSLEPDAEKDEPESAHEGDLVEETA